MGEGIGIRIDQRVNELYRDLDRIQQRAVRPALNTGIRHTVTRTATETRRATSKELGIKQMYIKRRIRSWNYGIRYLEGKVWIGHKRKLSVNSIKGASQALAERHKEYGTPIFAMQVKKGKYIWAQRKGSSKYKTAQPYIDYERIALKHMKRTSRKIINTEFDVVVGKTLKGLLERRGIFDVRALRAVRDFVETSDIVE